jgi:sirohydrochlorin ferrochelatase
MHDHLKNVALVLAAHGDRGGEARDETLRLHARRLQDTGLFAHVSAGALKSEGLPLEAALASAHSSAAKRIVIYPFFMADGYFTKTVLPKRIAEAGLRKKIHQLRPLGVDAGLPALVLDEAVRAAAASGLHPPHTRLLIVGHGSKLSRASLRSTERVACKVRQRKAFASVETAYLEEDPWLAAQLSSSPLPTLVSGFFSGDGLHAAEDVPEAIRQSGAQAVYCGPIGRTEAVVALIVAAVADATPGVGFQL